MAAVGISRRVGNRCEPCGGRGVTGICCNCLKTISQDNKSLPSSNGYLTSSPPARQQVKIVLIGAPGVGKTALAKQFVQNEYPDVHVPSRRRVSYFSSVVINEHLFELTIADIPAIRAFPQNSFSEWSDCRHYGLRSATAYIFMFDLTRADSFTHIKMLRDQLAGSKDIRDVGLVVVGNKKDLVADEEKMDYASSVRKHWKAPYLEVSAKYNWHVINVFKEVLLSYMEAKGHKELRSHNFHEFHEAIEHTKCTIL